jgi:hypothetical protein
MPLHRCRKSRRDMARTCSTSSCFRWTQGGRSSSITSCRRAFGVAFCRQCGGSTPRVAAAGGIVVVPAGPLDTDPGMRPLAHIFVASKAPWFDITDSIPQLAEGPPARPAR